ncbi:hypothetical protein BpHYR1_034081 [Brachionus plicatilis]|uniref:Uncharacterized protein n=1 Tax=Brachionus plicatilis TaxID=10195 RepID=A0A3M7R8F0_BRAPC|nr:hypothetical protein BpHYR1_034081 [Brachionus plicatilis]
MYSFSQDFNNFKYFSKTFTFSCNFSRHCEISFKTSNTKRKKINLLRGNLQNLCKSIHAIMHNSYRFCRYPQWVKQNFLGLII